MAWRAAMLRDARVLARCDDNGVLTINAERRAARVAAARGNGIRMAVMVISIVGLVAVATAVLLDRHTR